ncbi:MAG: V-type ATP synthase subunit I [Oscillospiraceae bacterium]|nr:V-type ATP synthase subunit I [Candidatus Ruminococcus equi]
MAILEMQRINVYALIKYCKDILEDLQRKGVIQIEDVNIEDSVFYKEDTSSIQSSFLRSASCAKDAAEILCEFVPQKKSLLSSFKGRTAITRKEYDTFVESSQEILRVAYDIISFKKNIEQNKAEIIKYESQLESIKPWETLDIPMTFDGTKTTKAFIGTFEDNLSSEDILLKLAETIPETDNISVDIISSDENQTCVLILCMNKDAETISDALREIGFAYPAYLSKSVPRLRMKEIKRHINNRKGRILEYTNNIKSYSGTLSALLFLEDYYIMKAERYSIVDNLSASAHTFVMSGYIVKNDAENLKSYLESKYDAEVELEDADELDVPIKLKNSKFTEPVESVLKTYSYPNRREIDPTSVMAIFYYIFFGMMFSDAGYGLVMTLVCGIMLLKFKNMEDGLKKSMKMFFWCGVSTTFWGLMFGSFFGDAISVISNVYFHTDAPNIPGLVSPLWFNPVTDPMRMLMFAFLLGVIHIFAGLFLQAVIDVKNKEYLSIIYDVVSWYLLVLGAIFALLSTKMMGDIAGFTLPPVFMTVGLVMMAVGAVIIVAFSGRESKNPIKRLLKGLYGLYGATGYLSDILSYSRLLALGLATGVIAQVFNQIGSMLGGGIFGLVMFTIIFLIGHSLNIGINALGAYVHTNRLQFVEFFGKFYTGGGEEFKPFRINTKHYIVKEEK